MTVIFDQPWLLALAVVLPALVVALLFVAHRRRRRRLARLGSDPVVARLIPVGTTRPPWRRALALGLAAACAGVAFAGPRWGIERQVVRGEGIDLVLALDASLSMMATDVRPNRLTRMKQVARQVLSEMPGTRAGLLAFAGRSYILTPLTVDQAAIDLYLDNLDPSIVGQAGSSTARAIRQGTQLLRQTQSGADRALVVMSDFEVFEEVEEVRTAAREAAEAGIMLVLVGYGTQEGANIPVEEDGRVVLKRDENGEIVVTRYRPEVLRAAAEAANGVAIEAEATDKATRIRHALADLRTQARAAVAGENRRPQFQLFLIPAVLLLLLDTALAERRGGRRRRRAAAATPTMSALLLAASIGACAPPAWTADLWPFGTTARRAATAYGARDYVRAITLYRQAVREEENDPRMLYNLGTSYLAADSLEPAAELLERVGTARDPELRYRALFNLGLAHLRAGLAADSAGGNAAPSLDAALAAYKKALLMRHDELDAKWNYELALRIRRGGGGGGGGGGEDTPSQGPTTGEQQPTERPAGGIGRDRAEQLLSSAAREEREVQARRQDRQRQQPPTAGRDW